MAETLYLAGRPERIRTSDQLIKSQLLCQLSYWPMIKYSQTKKSAPGRIRTCDLRVRSPALYPAELRARIFGFLPMIGPFVNHNCIKKTLDSKRIFF